MYTYMPTLKHSDRHISPYLGQSYQVLSISDNKFRFY